VGAGAETRLLLWVKASDPSLKEEHPELSIVYSQALQNVSLRVGRAFKTFFRRVKAGVNPDYPGFKGKERYDSFTY
jgi:putative transposase